MIDNYMVVASKQTVISFSIAFLLHIFLFFILFCTLNFPSTALQVGNNKIHIINSYLCQAIQQQQIKSITKIQNHRQQKIVQKDKTVVLEKSPTAKQIIKKEIPSSSTKTVIQAASDGSQTEPLLALLHDAIQQEQRYPASAAEMGRQGIVEVGFTLSANGNIDNLRLIKSSGTNSLDAAALEAVRGAVPFVGVNKYLSVIKNFDITIVFHLAAS